MRRTCGGNGGEGAGAQARAVVVDGLFCWAWTRRLPTQNAARCLVVTTEYAREGGGSSICNRNGMAGGEGLPDGDRICVERTGFTRTARHTVQHGRRGPIGSLRSACSWADTGHGPPVTSCVCQTPPPRHLTRRCRKRLARCLLWTMSPPLPVSPAWTPRRKQPGDCAARLPTLGSHYSSSFMAHFWDAFTADRSAAALRRNRFASDDTHAAGVRSVMA